jgi:hypothetical protein
MRTTALYARLDNALGLLGSQNSIFSNLFYTTAMIFAHEYETPTDKSRLIQTVSLALMMTSIFSVLIRSTGRIMRDARVKWSNLYTLDDLLLIISTVVPVPYALFMEAPHRPVRDALTELLATGSNDPTIDCGVIIGSC